MNYRCLTGAETSNTFFRVVVYFKYQHNKVAFHYPNRIRECIRNKLNSQITAAFTWKMENAQ